MTLFTHKEADQMSEQIKHLVNDFDKNKKENNLSAKINESFDVFSKNMLSYESPIDKANRNESLPKQLMLAAGIIATSSIPTGMLVGAAVMQNMLAGGAVAAIIPAGMVLGAGLISYLNNKANREFKIDRDFDKPLQAKHNEKHGNDFLKKLDDLNIGDAFKEIKAIVDNSIKNPSQHQENVIKEINKTIKKNNL